MAKKKSYGEADNYGQFKTELKAGEFHRVYAFHGEESYLVEYYRKQLKKKLVDGPAEDFNFHRFTEENWDVEAFQESVDAIPMMSEFSFVELVDVDLFAQPEAERKTLAEVFSSVPDYCVILLVCDTMAWKPDKRMKTLWSSMSDKLLPVEFKKQPESQLVPWIRRHLSTAKKTMSDDLCRYLILQTGGSMTMLAAELQKLMNYTDQTEITRKDIDDVVIPVMEAAVFDIAKDIGAKNFDSALTKLRELLLRDAEPVAINAAIGQQMRQLYAAKVLQEHKKGPYDLKSLYPKLWDSKLHEIYNQAGSFRKPLLRRAALLCADTDRAMKSGGGDPEELLELMVLKLARGFGGGH